MSLAFLDINFMQSSFDKKTEGRSLGSYDQHAHMRLYMPDRDIVTVEDC